MNLITLYTRKHKHKCGKIQIYIPPTLNTAHFFRRKIHRQQLKLNACNLELIKSETPVIFLEAILSLLLDKLCLFSLTQHRFILIQNVPLHACNIGHHQAYQYKNLKHEDIIKSKKPLVYHHCVFNNVKTEYKIKYTT